MRLRLTCCQLWRRVKRPYFMIQSWIEKAHWNWIQDNWNWTGQVTLKSWTSELYKKIWRPVQLYNGTGEILYVQLSKWCLTMTKEHDSLYACIKNWIHLFSFILLYYLIFLLMDILYQHNADMSRSFISYIALPFQCCIVKSCGCKFQVMRLRERIFIIIEKVFIYLGTVVR